MAPARQQGHRIWQHTVPTAELTFRIGQGINLNMLFESPLGEVIFDCDSKYLPYLSTYFRDIRHRNMHDLDLDI